MQQSPNEQAPSASSGDSNSRDPGDDTAQRAGEPGLTIEFVYRPPRKLSTADLANFGRFTDLACRRVFQLALIRTLRPEMLEDLQGAAGGQPFLWSASILRDLPPLYDELIELELGSLRARTGFSKRNAVILGLALMLIRVPTEKAFERSHLEEILEQAISTMVFDPIDRVIFELERAAKGTVFTSIDVTQPLQTPTHLQVVLQGSMDRDKERSPEELVEEALAQVRRRRDPHPTIPIWKTRWRR